MGGYSLNCSPSMEAKERSRGNGGGNATHLIPLLTALTSALSSVKTGLQHWVMTDGRWRCTMRPCCHRCSGAREGNICPSEERFPMTHHHDFGRTLAKAFDGCDVLRWDKCSLHERRCIIGDNVVALYSTLSGLRSCACVHTNNMYVDMHSNSHVWTHAQFRSPDSLF